MVRSIKIFLAYEHPVYAIFAHPVHIVIFILFMCAFDFYISRHKISKVLAMSAMLPECECIIDIVCTCPCGLPEREARTLLIV